MKAWCNNCDTTQQASFRPAKDYCTGRDYEDICCDECHFVIATVCDRGITPPLPREGWQLVPVEPTPEMVRHGNLSLGSSNPKDHTVRGCYTNMLAAAPKPEATP